MQTNFTEPMSKNISRDVTLTPFKNIIIIVLFLFTCLGAIWYGIKKPKQPTECHICKKQFVDCENELVDCERRIDGLLKEHLRLCKIINHKDSIFKLLNNK